MWFWYNFLPFLLWFVFPRMVSAYLSFSFFNPTFNEKIVIYLMLLCSKFTFISSFFLLKRVFNGLMLFDWDIPYSGWHSLSFKQICRGFILLPKNEKEKDHYWSWSRYQALLFWFFHAIDVNNVTVHLGFWLSCHIKSFWKHKL